MAEFFSGIVAETIAGLLVPALIAVGAFLIIRWRRRRIPLPPNDKIILLLARLEGDSGNVVREALQECVERELSGNVAVMRLDESLAYNEGYHDAAEIKLLEQAHEWLGRTGADLLVWGRAKSSNVVSLRFIPAKQKNTDPKTYVLTPDTLDIPSQFISNLGAAIAAYAAATVQSEVDTKKSVEGTLRTLSGRLNSLLKDEDTRFDSEIFDTLNHTAARAMVRLYDLVGREDDLREGVIYGQKALSLRDRATSPKKWAVAQNNLGTYLARLGERTGVVSYFDQAISALTAALEERPEEASFLVYAATKMNLASVYLARGQRATGDLDLREAARIFDEIEAPKLRRLNPEYYATLEGNKGALFSRLAQREDGLESLNKSLIAFTEALEVKTKEGAPFDWAITKINHANALITFGERTGDVALFQGAIDEARDALQIIKRQRNPRIWAIAQANLGGAQIVVGTETKDEWTLNEAISNLNSSLNIIERESDPVLWRNTQHNLGRAYIFLGELLGNVQLLRNALAPLEAALEQLVDSSDRRDKLLLLNEYGLALDLLPNLPSFIRRVCSSFAPPWGVLRTRSV
jgi:tetratricopeptide (TPR) repeat protein